MASKRNEKQQLVSFIWRLVVARYILKLLSSKNYLTATPTLMQATQPTRSKNSFHLLPRSSLDIFPFLLFVFLPFGYVILSHKFYLLLRL
jgi:hypothetical protein